MKIIFKFHLWTFILEDIEGYEINHSDIFFKKKQFQLDLN